MLILLFCLYIIFIYNNKNFVSLYSTQKIFVGEMPLDIITWKTSFGNCLALFFFIITGSEGGRGQSFVERCSSKYAEGCVGQPRRSNNL